MQASYPQKADLEAFKSAIKLRTQEEVVVFKVKESGD